MSRRAWLYVALVSLASGAATLIATIYLDVRVAGIVAAVLVPALLVVQSVTIRLCFESVESVRVMHRAALTAAVDAASAARRAERFGGRPRSKKVKVRR